MFFFLTTYHKTNICLITETSLKERKQDKLFPENCWTLLIFSEASFCLNNYSVLSKPLRLVCLTIVINYLPNGVQRPKYDAFLQPHSHVIPKMENKKISISLTCKLICIKKKAWNRNRSIQVDATDLPPLIKIAQAFLRAFLFSAVYSCLIILKVRSIRDARIVVDLQLTLHRFPCIPKMIYHSACHSYQLNNTGVYVRRMCPFSDIGF